MADFRNVEDRYFHDPLFHHLVDAIEAMIETLQCTPTEAREACMFAQMRVEARHPRSFAVPGAFIINRDPG